MIKKIKDEAKRVSDKVQAENKRVKKKLNTPEKKESRHKMKDKIVEKGKKTELFFRKTAPKKFKDEIQRYKDKNTKEPTNEFLFRQKLDIGTNRANNNEQAREAFYRDELRGNNDPKNLRILRDYVNSDLNENVPNIGEQEQESEFYKELQNIQRAINDKIRGLKNPGNNMRPNVNV